MKLLVNTTDYNETIELAKNLTGDYNKPVIFHCYWSGDLNAKHFYSIQSCYYFNVYKNKHKIILWLENNTPNEYNTKIEKYAELRYYNYEKEYLSLNYNRDTYFKHNKKDLTELTDFIRLNLLYNYGGIWFDLDIFFLRSFDPLFYQYENEICTYQWEKQNFPNNAIVISLIPQSDKLKNTIDFFHNQNTGWRTQGNCKYNSPLDMLVLPCSWFNGDWIENPYNIGTEKFFEQTDKTYDFTNFFTGSFCYHWHNKWQKPIHPTSIIQQLSERIQADLQ